MFMHVCAGIHNFNALKGHIPGHDKLPASKVSNAKIMSSNTEHNKK